jgi:peptidoglycan-N-acetylglucosamine deacetylase
MKQIAGLLMYYLLLMFSFCNNNSTVLHEGENSLPKTPEAQHYTIYLTFDDGPLGGSKKINEAVLEEKIKINVFVVGVHAQRKKSMLRLFNLYLQNPFIEVGNHSYSHAHNRYKTFYNDPAKVLADFLKCQDKLNIPLKLARLPGRNQWRLKDTAINDVNGGAASADLLFKEGFKVFGWDLEWQHDAETGVPVQTVDDITEKIETLLKEGKTVHQNHLVLLAHDEMFGKGWEESELKQLIEQLKAKGNYTFEHLSKYPG